VTVLEGRASLERLLRGVRTVAVVGLSPNPERDSHHVSRYLHEHGFRVIGVNPNHAEVLGERCYPSLGALPPEIRRQVDLVVVFRRPEEVPAVIDEAASLGLRRIWLQLGVSSPEALARAEKHDLEVVAEKCVRVVHSIFLGKKPA
jgi:predicted CoA-binding protein